MKSFRVFSKIVYSSLWEQDDAVRLVWITLLALAEPDGVVQCTMSALARIARVELVQVAAALNKLSDPDPESSSKESQGRRIVAVEGGWRLVNYQKYQQVAEAEEKRAKWRSSKARSRKRKAASVILTDPPQQLNAM